MHLLHFRSFTHTFIRLSKLSWKFLVKYFAYRLLKRHSNICMEIMKKTTESHSKNSRCPGQDLNLDLSEYEAEILSIQLRFLSLSVGDQLCDCGEGGL
jgi:hypothetical protein